MEKTTLLYLGRRDPRLVTVRCGGTLKDPDHRLMAKWAPDCADHVLHLFERVRSGDDRPRRAVEKARAWACGEIEMMEARRAAVAAHAAAREADGAAREAARAAGHELGAAYYAIRAVRAAADPKDQDEAGRAECLWQRDQLPAEVRDLIIDDERIRNRKCWSLFYS
jgi:hypothetical protein